MKRRIAVVGAAIVDGELLLAAQRKKSQQPHSSLKWELPGGKIQAGKTPYAAVKREIMEELDCEVIPVRELTQITHEYPEFTLDMTVIVCRLSDGENPACLEHNAIAWCRAEELDGFDWADADRKVLNDLKEMLS